LDYFYLLLATGKLSIQSKLDGMDDM